jgi:outer membrane protein OmpA-like peptidoglycan-associated protein
VNVAQQAADEPPVRGHSGAKRTLSLLLAATAVFVVLIGVAAWRSAQRIQDDLATRSRTALASYGLPGTVTVRYDGLDAVLTGTVTHPQEAADAIGAVISVSGTRHVTSRLSMGNSADTGTDTGTPVSPTLGSTPATPSATPSIPGPQFLPGKIIFATNDARLSAVAKAHLDQVAAYLTDHPQVRLTVRGHSDNSGTDEINWALSKQRAVAVVAYLVHRHVAADRLRPAAFAATSPVASNDTPDGRAANRRVEFAIEEGH